MERGVQQHHAVYKAKNTIRAHQILYENKNHRTIGVRQAIHADKPPAPPSTTLLIAEKTNTRLATSPVSIRNADHRRRRPRLARRCDSPPGPAQQRHFAEQRPPPRRLPATPASRHALPTIARALEPFKHTTNDYGSILTLRRANMPVRAWRSSGTRRRHPRR